MIVISERPLTDDEIKSFRAKGYRIAYGYENPVIKYNESVGIILDVMYKSTMDLIDSLLYRHHRVTIKYEGSSYTLESIDEWKKSYQSDKDSLKMTFECHPIYRQYLDKRNEYFERRKTQGIRQQYEIIYDYIDRDEIPNDDELDNFLRTFGYLYQVDVDYTDRLSKLYAYMQLKWYLENDIPYVNEPLSIAIEDEPMFNKNMFVKIPWEEPIEVISIGKEALFEDLIYKAQQDSTKISTILKENI